MSSDLPPFLRLLAPVGFGWLSFHRGPMPGEPRDARFLDVDGTRVRYVDTGGNLPVVVLLHGFASAIEAWNPVVPHLSATHRVIALDFKGFGWSDRPEGDYSPEAQAKLLLRLLELLAVEKAAFVAHSWGAAVALAATLKAPERVTKLALYNAWVYEAQLPTMFHWARTEGVGEMMFGLYYKSRAEERMALAFFDKRIVTPRFVREVCAALDRPGTVAAALAAVRGQRFSHVESRYRTIDKPTLLLWGREDEVSRLRFGERLARDLPKAKLVIYPQCGHFPMIEAKDSSNHDLLAFLAEAS